MTTQRETINEFCAAVEDAAERFRAGADLGDVARQIVEKMTPNLRTWMAVRHLCGEVHDVIRDETREAERSAEQPHRNRSTPKSGGNEIKHGSIDKRLGGVTHGCDCDQCVQVRVSESEIMVRYNLKMQGIIDDYVARLRIEWTEELLGATFARNDGTLVTWGDASSAEHRERIAMFTGNAQANLEGAARHQKALDELEASGASCLNDLVAVAA